MALTLPGAVVPADAAAGPTSLAQIDGWSGHGPVPIALGLSGEQETAVFTTVESSDDGVSLWVANGFGQVWGAPRQLASGVTASSADFAENASGAAVLAWDALATDGRTSTWVSRRRSAEGPWSEPAAVVTDGLSTHQPSVGIDLTGQVTLGYVRTDAGQVGAFTRRSDGDAWAEEVEQSSAPVVQARLVVSRSGVVTMAWSQVDFEGGPGSEPADHLNLYTRRSVTASQGWAEPVRLENDVSRTGLVALVANSNDLATVAYYTDSYNHIVLVVARNRNGFPTHPCWPDCPNEWITSIEGGTPVIGLSINDSLYGQTFKVVLRDLVGGDVGVASAQDNGTSYYPADYLASGGQNSDPMTVRNGDRVAVSWLTHTSAGNVLSVRGEWVPQLDHATPDPDTSVVGVVSAPPALAVSDTGDTEVLWANPDADGQGTALRVTTLGANQMIDPSSAFTGSLRVPVHWSTATRTSTPTRFDVRTRRATTRHGFGRSLTWQKATTATGSLFRSAAGQTTCFSTRVRRPDASAGSWSSERCTAAPLDDTVLTGRGWAERTASDAFGGSTKVSQRRGASLTSLRTRARSVALLVSRSPGAGRVTVRLGARTLGVFSTSGRRRARAVIKVAHFTHTRSGRLTITVSGRQPVRIDGVFLSAR